MRYYIELQCVDGLWVANELLNQLSDSNAIKLLMYVSELKDCDTFCEMCESYLSKKKHFSYFFIYDRGLNLCYMHNKITNEFISDIDIIAFETFIGSIKNLLISLDYTEDSQYKELINELLKIREED